MKHKAIYTLYPNVVRISNDQAFDANGDEVSYDREAVQAYADAQAYKERRRMEYPSIGDQLDALFHAGVFPAEMAAAIQAVKDKYPKG